MACLLPCRSKCVSLWGLKINDMATTKKITVQGSEISVLLRGDDSDYICLTDMAKSFEGGSKLIEKWLSNKSTIDFIGVWEQLNNPNFNSPEFGGIRTETGSNSFYISVTDFVKRTSAVGIFAKAGRYGGTFAHKDIAYHFGMWLSPEFYLLVIKEFQRLKETESNPLVAQWDLKRMLSKTNYALHTDAIKNNLIPKLSISKLKERVVYASEADMLNIIMFGCTAKDWESQNPECVKKGMNMRDYATVNQLLVLSNIEALNSLLIKRGVARDLRISYLHKVAKEQLRVFDEQNIEQRFRKFSLGDDIMKLD